MRENVFFCEKGECTCTCTHFTRKMHKHNYVVSAKKVLKMHALLHFSLKINAFNAL